MLLKVCCRNSQAAPSAPQQAHLLHVRPRTEAAKHTWSNFPPTPTLPVRLFSTNSVWGGQKAPGGQRSGSEEPCRQKWPAGQGRRAVVFGQKEPPSQ